MPHPNHPEPNRPDIFTAAEIEKMRLYVIEHDKRASPNVFDLNNPPREPYAYREFPRVVYHHDARTHKLVHDPEQLQAALDAGHKLDQFPAEAPEVELDPADAAEVAALDLRIAEVRAKNQTKKKKK